MTADPSTTAPPSVAAAPFDADDEISLLAIGSTLLEYRFLILKVMLLVGSLAVVPSLFMPSTYTSDALVVSSEGSGGDARLQGLAGQFGINLGGARGGSVTTTPNFLVNLANSRVILERILGDTVVTEDAPGGIALLDVLVPPKEREGQGSTRPDRAAAIWRDRAIDALRDTWITLRADRDLAALRISVTTNSALLSRHVAQRILEELGRFNVELAQARAGDERRFAQERMAGQEQALRAAEARLGRFLQANRQFRNSPELSFEHDRLQREVALQQQVLIQLAQSNEEARLREVRDTPVLTVIEPPVLAVTRDPKGRVKRGVLGLLVGGMLGAFSAILVASARKQGSSDDPEAKRFMALLAESVSFRRTSTPAG